MTFIWASLLGIVVLLTKACGRHTPRGVSHNFLLVMASLSVSKKSRTRGDVNHAGLSRRQQAHQNRY